MVSLFRLESGTERK